MCRRLLVIVGLALLASGAGAQFLDQRYTLTPAERAELTAGVARLDDMIDSLAGRRGGPPPLLPDAAVYRDAVHRNLRQNLFFTASQVDQARRCLADGEARLAALRGRGGDWDHHPGFLTLAYRSEVDGSYQPYQVWVPGGYDFNHPAPVRLDIFLHGRGGNLNELTFLTNMAWSASSFGAGGLRNLTLYPYGRGNNGWRWAGERDLFEALADLQKRFSVDPDQITLRGFSMGGHGAWHVGLQHPGDWAAMSPGAGFTDTRNYQKITEPFPDWQTRLLRMYDPIDYVANARNLPVLAYCGEEDPALDQHQQIVAALKADGAPFAEFMGPRTPHRYEPTVLRRILTEMAKHDRKPDSARVDFTTYTLRWPECKWVRLEGMDRHWERAEVHAGAEPAGLEVTTRNISALTLSPPPPSRSGKLHIDGQTVAVDLAGEVALVRREGRWRVGKRTGLRKRPGLQGPIDDALFGPVLAVGPSGTPWSAAQDQWARRELQRFRDGWDEYFRADLPERRAEQVGPNAGAHANLYLFGDPGSNPVLARLLPRLPLRWTKDEFEMAGRKFSTAGHVPTLIYPNPEHPDRYVVINCGFTFSRADWQGSNARQYAHLPDYAVLRIDPDHYSDDHRANALLAGFYDERWRIAR